MGPHSYHSYYFSTPMANTDGLPNPCVLVTAKRYWDDSQRVEEDNKLSVWMRKNGFGELMPNYYQADNQELMTPEAVINFLSMYNMTHNTDLDPVLEQGLEL